MMWTQDAIPLIGIFLMCLRITTQSTSQQYHFINQPLTWTEAQSYCREKYTDLATVANMDDMNELVRTLGSNIKHSWIGLERRGPMRWLWSDGSGTAHFTKWRADEPNNVEGNEWCGELTEGTWNDKSCDNAHSFVCYQSRQDGMVRYAYYTGAWSWVAAQEICRTQCTDLVTIRNDMENSELSDLAKAQTTWIGLFADSWMWSDGSDTSFRYWENGKPDNYLGSENCAHVGASQQGHWDDVPCHEKLPFVCHGGLKTRKTLVKMMMSSDVDLSDSTISTTLLQKLETGLRNQSMSDFTLSWRSNKDGQIFKRKEEQEGEGAAEQPCEDKIQKK